MKNISTVFVLLFMITAFAVPLFPLGAEEDCCCGDACMCETNEQMSCSTEITACDLIPVMPIPAAPLNKVVVEQLQSSDRQAGTDPEFLEDQINPLVQLLTHSSGPPLLHHLPLLI